MSTVDKTITGISANIDTELKIKSQTLALRTGVSFQDYISVALKSHNITVEKKLINDKMPNVEA